MQACSAPCSLYTILNCSHFKVAVAWGHWGCIHSLGSGNPGRLFSIFFIGGFVILRCSLYPWCIPGTVITLHESEDVHVLFVFRGTHGFFEFRGLMSCNWYDVSCRSPRGSQARVKIGPWCCLSIRALAGCRGPRGEGERWWRINLLGQRGLLRMTAARTTE